MGFAKGHSEEVKNAIYTGQHGFCCVKNCLNSIEDFHHPLHNTKANRNNYPLLIQSVINCRGCCRKHHDNYTQYPELNINENIAKVYEDYLRELKET